jgi:hypothetical protein
MADHTTNTSPAGLDTQKLLAALEVPFPPSQVHWRVMNTSHDKKRGQIVPYADPRAYTDRLNALFSPQGWTRTYRVETMNNITRVEKNESFLTGKVLVTCTVTIIGLGSHSGTGEEWAHDPNSLTAADAQAFKRACCQFGLGRYFYDFVAPWVDLDQYRQPVKTPALPAWAMPENWRRGMRPPHNNGNGNALASRNAGQNGNGNGAPRPANSPARTPGGKPANGASNGNGQAAGSPSSGNGNRSNGSGANETADLDARIMRMEVTVGIGLYRHILREHGRVNQPKLIRDAAVKEKVLRVLESAARGFARLEAVKQRLGPNTVSALLAKLQAPPLDQIADMKTLEQVVFGLEDLAGPNQNHAA